MLIPEIESSSSSSTMGPIQQKALINCDMDEDVCLGEDVYLLLVRMNG